MAYNTVVVIEHTDPIQRINSGARKAAVLSLANELTAYAAGAKRGVELDILANDTEATAAATGTVTISSGSGAITITINGVTAASETWATSDAATATALAADINASSDALVSGLVTATDDGAGVVTITTTQKGRFGNCITLAASGTGATASAARLTGGTGANGTYVNFVP